MGKNLINVALFGLGRIGLMHANNLINNKNFNLKYIFDVNRKLAKKVSKNLNCQNIESPQIAYKDKKNADILNYLGFALRKTGDFEKAEKFYLEGLKIDAAHLGINEYLGELYVQTNRIELAKERLQVLNGCKCEEYDELKELIEKN